MRLLLAILLSFLLLSGVAEAGDEVELNKMLENGGEVHLESRVYNLEGPVIIHSNTVLSGEPGTILRVSSSSSQWFTGQTGIICNPKESLKNVEIYGFAIDGNIKNLPKSYANSRSDTRHDCEKLILIGGWSSDFGNNIKIHHMKLYNSFSDGIYVRFSKNVEAYDNIISNCQHEGIYYSVVQGGKMRNNKIAGITSDAARADNCKNLIIEDNLFFSYGGDSFGAFKGGENGLQIGDSKSSHGYNAEKPQFKTENIEVRNNTFSDPGLLAIWLHPNTKNVFIHSNLFLDAAGLETDGFSFETEDYTVDNPPSLETSESIFTSILDYLKQEYVFQYPVFQQDFGAYASVVFHNNDIQPHALIDVQGKDDIKVIKIKYAGKEAKHFIEKDIWTGELSPVGDQIYIPGNFQADELQITVYGKSGYQKVEKVEINEVKLESTTINPDLIIFISVLILLGITTCRNLRRVL